MLTMLGSGAWPGVDTTPAVTVALTATALNKSWRAPYAMPLWEIYIIFWFLALALLTCAACGFQGRASVHCSCRCLSIPFTGCYLIPLMLTMSRVPSQLMLDLWLLAAAAFVVASLSRT